MLLTTSSKKIRWTSNSWTFYVPLSIWNARLLTVHFNLWYLLVHMTKQSSTQYCRAIRFMVQRAGLLVKCMLCLSIVFFWTKSRYQPKKHEYNTNQAHLIKFVVCSKFTFLLRLPDSLMTILTIITSPSKKVCCLAKTDRVCR